MYISFYDTKKAEYDRAGRALTQHYNELKELYRNVETGADLAASAASLRAIETSYYQIAISKQILFSDWYAHYKFFAQHQIDWLDSQLKFTWRDKFPVSLRVAAAIILAAAIALYCHYKGYFSG